MSYTSQARQNAYDYLRFLSRHRLITSEIFKSSKAKIDVREAKAVAIAEAKRIQREAEVLARREAKKAETAKRNKDKAEAKKHEKLIRTIPNGLLRDRYTATSELENSIRDMWKMTVGSRSRFIGGRVDVTLDVSTGDRGYKAFRLLFLDGSDNYMFEGGTKFLILQPTPIEAEKLVQRFRNGINHCVFTPVISKLQSMVENVSPATKKRLGQRINKLTALSLIYADGVPECKMDEVAKASGLKIHLHDVLGNDLALYNRDGRVGSLHMTNTRENHVDIGIVVDSDPTELEQPEMITLWNSIKDTDKFYMIDGDLKEGLPTKIRTLEGAWRVKDPMRDACSEFDKELGIINYKVNAMKQPELNAFLKAGRIINGWSTTLNGGDATGCADMPSAYAQFKKCEMYSGFLGHVHQFRSGVFTKEFVEKHLGYYQVTVRGGIDWLSEKLGLYVGLSTVLFGPELLYFIKNGLIVDITQGAWGSRFDFDFPEYMMEDIIIKNKNKKPRKERPYCHWAGRLGIEREETSHTISASQEWASHIGAEHKVFYWREQGLVTIKKPVKQCFTAHHILGALTAYTRIQMMEAMRQFEPSNLVRVVLDGIYYKGEKPAGLAWFKDKDVKVTEDSMGWYADEEVPVAPPLCNIVGNSLLTGQGGSGKTYSVFMNPGFNTILYVSPSHILGQDVHQKYKAKYTTIHKLIGIDCRPYCEEFRVPPVIFVDEITQIDAAWIDKVFELYPESLILLAGDVDNTGRWFQCRSGGGEEWNTIWTPKDVDVIEYLDDRRSRDDDLKALKLNIRNVMAQCDLENGLYQMEEWARKLPISEFVFVPGDTCIAGTHRTNAKLLEKGIVSGYYKKGGAVSDVPLPNFEKRGSFTIHSYQGKTIETGSIWIFIDDLFEYAMLYTAVSRAVNRSQIKFVRSRDL
jgi:hypothetical protein